MEYVDGKNLKQYIREKGAFQPGGGGYFLQIAAALVRLTQPG